MNLAWIPLKFAVKEWWRMSMMILGMVVVVVILLIAAGVGAGRLLGDQAEGGGENMIRTVYIYLVLFSTLMMSIGGTVAAFMAAADIVAPTAYYQSFEEYKTFPKDPANPNQVMSDEELRARYDAMVADQKARSRENGVNSLIKSFGWIIIPLPVFLYFQRRVKNQQL